MPINIDTSAITSFKGPQPITLSDMLGIAGKALEVQKLSELYPEYIRKTKAEAQSAEQTAEVGRMNLANTVASKIHQGQIALINNPLVISAERGDPVDPAKLEELVIHNARVQAKNAGIPEDRAMELVQPYLDLAKNNPKALRQYGKDRLMAGLDTSTQLTATTPTMGTSGGQPAAIYPLQETVLPLKIPGQTTQSSVVPPQGLTKEEQTAPGLQPQQMGRPASSQAGFNLRFPMRQPGDIRPFALGEENQLKEGEAFLSNLTATKDQIPIAKGYLDETMRLAGELGADSIFTTGKLGEVERNLRQQAQDPRFQELRKNIARTQIMLLKAQGHTVTDADKMMISAANGTEDYAPQNLMNIVRKQLTEFKNLDMQQKGANQFVLRGFNPANLQQFRQEWANTATQPVLEAMVIEDIMRESKTPEARKSAVEALERILPNNKKDLTDFQNRIRKLRELSNTGMTSNPGER